MADRPEMGDWACEWPNLNPGLLPCVEARRIVLAEADQHAAVYVEAWKLWYAVCESCRRRAVGENRCGSCKHWDTTWGGGSGNPDDGPVVQHGGGPLDGNWGDCQGIREFGTGSGGRSPSPLEPVEGPAFLSDGSGYYASLTTRDDFGCTLWEATDG